MVIKIDCVQIEGWIMDSSELNRFIERYAREYITKTALMLTGEWGSGKSYYIEHELCPYLKKGKACKVIVVSLYGIESLEELSKCIYLSIRVPTLSKNNEALTAGKVAIKSIFSNLLAFNGISFNVSNHDLKKLYKSINIKNTLIILEDVERSTIEISKLLGFVNGLVEYDGAKVLLVANEKEILKENDETLDLDFTSILQYSRNEEVPKEQEPDEAVEKYLKIKEKTIGDTIQFYADIPSSVESIIKSIKGEEVRYIATQDEMKRISGIVISQKYKDIFDSLNCENKYDDKFYQATFEGLLILSSKILRKDFPAWEGTQYISSSLGSSSSPVFRFVYDYLRWQNLENKDIDAAHEEYKDYLCFEKYASRENDKDLNIVSDFMLHKEADVVHSLKAIEKKVKNENYVGIYAYEKLAYAVIRASNVVGYDSDSICESLLENARKLCRRQHHSAQEVIWGIYSYESDGTVVIEKYKRFIKDFSDILNSKPDMSGFSYNPSELREYHLKIGQNKYSYIIQHRFLSLFDGDKLVTMLLNASSEQMCDFNGVLLIVYGDVAKGTFDESDRQSMIDLSTKLDNELKRWKKWDKIQQFQIKNIQLNLKDFIAKM